MASSASRSSGFAFTVATSIATECEPEPTPVDQFPRLCSGLVLSLRRSGPAAAPTHLPTRPTCSAGDAGWQGPLLGHDHLEAGPRDAQRVLHLGRRVAAGEQEPEVAVALGKRLDGTAVGHRDLEALDARASARVADATH